MQTISIEDQALQTYEENLIYLQENKPTLYKKIVDFELAVENGYYQSRYELEYKDEGYFDVLELSSGNYLYGSDSNEYAKDAKKSIDYRKEDNTFIVFGQYNFDKEFLRSVKKSSIFSNNHLIGTAEIINLCNKNIPANSIMKRLEKFIFFGSGLGLHIKSVHEKINSDFYLIVEDDLELFRLSMFVTSYLKLSKDATLYFSVFDDDNEAKKVMEEFLEDGFMHNHYIKFLHTLNHSEKKMRVMHEVTASPNYKLFPYSAYFFKYLTPLYYLKEEYNFLNLILARDIFKDKRVLILAAGPSLAKNIKWVKEHNDRFVTIALTSSLSTLEREGIVPDIITHLDPFSHGSLPHLQKLKNKDYFTKPICLFGAQTAPEVAQMFKKENIFIFNNNSSYREKYGDATATCVGSISYILSLMLGASEIYLLGLDLSIDEESGATHSNSHAHSKKLDLSRVDKMEEIFDFKDSLIRVEGNFKDEVLTTANFFMSINSVKSNSKKVKRVYQKSYNLSNGAKLYDTIPLKLDKVDCSKSQSKNFDLKELFLQNSNSKLDESEIEFIYKMLLHAKSVRKILKKYRSKKYKTIEEYQYALMGLSLDVTAQRSKVAGQLNIVLLHFMMFIFPYIFDLFNTREVKNYKELIVRVDKLLVAKMMLITDIFIERLEDFFQDDKSEAKSKDMLLA